MNINDNQLNRLLKMAAVPPPLADNRLSPALRARILAEWRALRPDAERLPLQLWFQLALGFACVVLLLTAAFSYREIRQEQTDEFTIPNAVINLALSR